MPRILLVGLLILAIKPIMAQEPYGFKQFHFDTLHTDGLTCLVKIQNNQHAIFYASRKALNGKRFIVGHKIDNQSLEIIDSVIVETSFEEFTFTTPNGGSLTTDNKINLPIVIVDSSNNTNAAVCIIDAPSFDADTIFKFQRPRFNVLNKSHVANNGCQIHIGRNYVSEENGDIWLVKMAPSGEVLWEKHYGTEYIDFGFSLTTDDQGNIYLGGNSRGYGQFMGVKGDAIIIKADSLGNEVWRRTWGGSETDLVNSLFITNDNSLITVGNTSTVVDWYPSSSIMGNIRKWDLDGNLTWEIEFDWPLDSTQDSIEYFRSVKPLGNNRFIAVGGGEFRRSPSVVDLAPVACVFNGDGEILMTRHYTSILDTANEAGFNEILPLDDGSFIAGGPYDDNQRGGQGFQDAFILKLDENGCEYAACQPPLEVEEILDAGEIEFAAYPNPFNHSITFETYQAKGNVFLYDMSGQLVFQKAASEPSFTYAGHNLHPGIYLAVFHSDNGTRSTLKLLKQ